jgi:branched-chain amino acid transport system substrate-binding protein
VGRRKDLATDVTGRRVAMRRGSGTKVVLLLVAAMALGVVPVGAQEPIKLGVLIPLTGTVAAIGATVKHAAELAADVVNNEYDLDMPMARTRGIPSLGGAKVELVIADTQGSPEIGRAEAERLITTQKVVAISGAWHSGVTHTVSPVTERYKIPIITQSVAPTLSQRGFKYFFRGGPNSPQALKVMFEFLEEMARKGTRVQKVAIISEDTAWGKDGSVVYERFSKERGWQVAGPWFYSQNTTDVTSEVQKLKAANADVVFQSSYTSDLLLFLREYKKQRYAAPAVFSEGGGFDDPKFYEVARADANYFITRLLWSIDLGKRKPLALKVNELFRKRAGLDLDANSVREFAHIILLAEAINRAGSANPEEIQKALVRTEVPEEKLPLAYGVKFDPNHDNLWAGAMLGQVQEGKRCIIYPAKHATCTVVWPFPKWETR